MVKTAEGAVRSRAGNLDYCNIRSKSTAAPVLRLVDVGNVVTGGNGGGGGAVLADDSGARSDLH